MHILKFLKWGLGAVAYAYNLTYMGGSDHENYALRPVQAKI
jgi:hypothetical protein